MIQGECPVCHRVFKVDDRYAGMTGHCKACGASIRVPGRLDEGLDGLPMSPGLGPEPPAAAAPNPDTSPAAPPPKAEAPTPQAPAAPQPAVRAEPAAQHPHPADESGRPRDARARFEPSEGPTALKGSWLRREEQGAPPGPVPGPEAEPPAPAPARAVLADRLITAPEAEPAPTQHRPGLVRVSCVLLGLLAVCFALHLATAGTWGQVAAGLGVALAGLAIVRLWMAAWDGLLAGLLLCLCVASSALLPSEVPVASRVLLAGSGVVLLLLFLTLFRSSGRDYFTN
ncbi:MAG TPA: hypothetical protein VNE39_28520 [Planctomycetota bacterium]|nr:hypothetical protein [Planctomycetota bacterium]